MPTDDVVDLLAAATFLTADAEREAVVRFTATVALEQPAGRVASAVLHATAHGIYELRIGGQPVTDSVFNPGWTAYEWRLQYQSFDVTDLVGSGSEELPVEALVGNGWYRGDFGFEDLAANYGEEIGLLAALVIDYRDGTRQVFDTSTGWAASTTEITANSIYQGEVIDARLRGLPGTELGVRAGEFDSSRLVPQVGPLVRRQERLAPLRIWRSPSGRTLVDFGQNLVGWVRVRVSGQAGTVVTVRHAEVLEHDELGIRPLRAAAATDRYTLSGGEDEFEPTYTFHGFRYAEVDGWPGELDPAALEAVVVHSDLLRTTTFECSEPLVNQLVSNSVWGQKGNFLSVPTDCPQRDERLGWTGDIAVYAATAAAQFDVSDFLHSWLLDLAVETSHHQPPAVPVVVPDILKHGQYADDAMFRDVHSQAVWSDAAVWVPQALWEAYGDVDRLAAHYPGMVAYLDSVEPLLSPTGLWDQGMQLADWLDPDAPPDQPWAAKAHPGVVATAALHRSAPFAAEAATILGMPEAERWTVLSSRLRTAFRAHYVADERVTSDCATVYALAICFGLLDDDELPWAAGRLAEVVRGRNHEVTTGFAGTPYVTWALSENGYPEDAYKLLLQTGCPSWLYPVTMGATTIWERWDSMLPDGTINPGDMTSFNHYALGAVADWIYQVIGGIRPADPGFRRLLIQPVPGPGIQWARTNRNTPAGGVGTEWHVDSSEFTLHVAVPDGVDAEIVLPDGSSAVLHGGTGRFSCVLPDQGTGR
jgi:alpha-L-rhamnosidase